MAGLGVLEVSDATFDEEVLRSEQPVLVDFWAVWCGPCRALAPMVDSLATTYTGKLKVAKMNVDENGATPSRYGIRGIPTLLFFKGGKVADQVVGYVPQNVIEEKVAAFARLGRNHSGAVEEIRPGIDCRAFCFSRDFKAVIDLENAYLYLRSTPSTRPWMAT